MKTIAHAILAPCLALSVCLAAAQTMCTKSPCQATVVVPGDCGNGIVVSPDPIHVKSAQAIDIEWTIQDGVAWAFDGGNGVVIQKTPGDFSPDAKNGSNPKKFTSRLKNPVAGKVYKYDINLTKGTGDSLRKCRVDPTIVNH